MPLRTIIIKATRSGTASTVIIRRGASGTGTGGGDHGTLTGLGDDDHTQYHNDARGDARYITINGNAGTPSAIVLTNATGNASALSVNFAVTSLYANDAGMAGGVARSGIITALLSAPLPITSGGTGVGSVGELGTFRTALGSKATGDLLFQSETITDARGILGSQFKRRVANSSGNSTTILVADTELAGFVMEANAVYRVEYHLRFEGAGGAQAQFKIPSDSGFPSPVNGLGGSFHSGGAIDYLRRVSATQYRAVSQNATPLASTGYGIIQIGPAGGTMDVTWCQFASNVAPTIMLAGSIVILTRIA